ncbi:MAG: type II toxin-antitoxin system RelE/ParE family toxin [Devosia sp.]|nr:type II toxin-antitoxin system RelE/ParE family toxin [Devosia sp.]
MPGRELRLTSTARDDLGRLAAYIIATAGMPATAANYIRRIEARCVHLCDFPAVGRSRSDISAGLRVVPFEGVIIAFKATDSLVRVLRIYGQRQDYERKLSRDSRES